jgi:hypothetical protein
MRPRRCLQTADRGYEAERPRNVRRRAGSKYFVVLLDASQRSEGFRRARDIGIIGFVSIQGDGGFSSADRRRKKVRRLRMSRRVRKCCERNAGNRKQPERRGLSKAAQGLPNASR